MNASYKAALQAARDAAGNQNYPQGALYVIATPIGNLADVTLRALHVLALVDLLACEDTRHTRGLLQSWGIDKPASQWLALHQHNEARAAAEVIERLKSGMRIGYASDAGTPAISDPGARLVAAVRAAGLLVVPVPGVSSVTAALSVAGIADSPEFIFVGFLPSKAEERSTAVRVLAGEPRAVVLLEAPHRVQALADALGRLGPRAVTIARELTKRYEQVETVPADHLKQWLASSAQQTRGEFVLVLHPAAGALDTAAQTEGARILGILLAELPLRSAVDAAQKITGIRRKRLYQEALLRQTRHTPGEA